uniref:DNA repair protein REV1 n=1 Tax=Scylla olivacea TaxID=85551 RepID=A0A0P4VTD3_SCYOL
MCGRGGGRRRRGYGASGFEEAGGYMAAKISKLQNQYKDSVSTREGEEKKGLFHGVAIFVNGYTEPTAEELKRLMMVHGGTYHHYYSRSQTTHIIAHNLPDTKIKNMNTERIVSPKWIVNSIAAGHLLDYTKYILYGNQSRSQPRLQFKSALPPDKGTESLENLVNESSVKDEQKSETYKESKCISLTNDALGAHQGNTAASDNSEDTEAKIEGERDFKRHLVISANSPNSNIDNKHSPVKGHAMSTANPKFLSEFYNNSRLHHISTMGAMFKEYINELQNKGDGFPGREKLKEWITNRGFSKNGTTVNEGFQCSSPRGKNKRIIMHIDMDCFFVSVGLRKHPELRDKPVAVTHGRGNSQGHVREGMDRQYELNFYKQRAQKKLKAKMLATGSTIKDEDLTAGQQDGDEHKEQSTERLEKRFATIDLIDDTSSLSEIASCNYEARKAGVRNGMFLGPALKLCPHLKTIPYDFEGYKEVSYKLYDIVASFTHDIEAVSCDEMFVDLTELLQSCKVSPEDFTTYLRERVQEETGCPCSAGLGANMLVARMATRHAKPNGQHWADPEDLLLYMKDHKATELPGVGWSTGKRLEAEGLTTCGDLQKCSLGQLQSLLGPRTGQSLYNYCRGVDTRAVKSEHVRKSVSAEVNYGIRFTCQNDAHKFISELAAEVESRLAAIKMKGKCITLKLKVRAKDAPIETAKFMGHGVCDNIAKSVSLSLSTSSADIIERETLGLLKQIKNPPQDFRGVGIQVSRLEATCASKPPGTSIKSFLLGAKKKAPGMGTHAAGTLVADISVSKDETSVSGSSNPEVVVKDSIKNFLLGAKKKSSGMGRSPAGTLVMDAFLGAGDTSAPENRNVEVLTKHSRETKPSHQERDAGQSTDAGHLLSGSHQPTSLSNSTSYSESKSIDMEVLLALPEDMRDQVIAEYKQQGYIIPILPSGRDSSTACRPAPQPQPQPSTSGYIEPEERNRRETYTINKPQSTVDGAGRSRNTPDESRSEIRDGGRGRDTLANRQNSAAEAAVVREPAAVENIGETSHSSHSFATFTEYAQDSALITSFSQVDASFLEAIPEELQKELKQDLEHLKQVREAAAPLPGNNGLQRSPLKQENMCSRGRGQHRGRRGRRGKVDSRRLEAEGLVTLTSMFLGNTDKHGNFTIKKNITSGKKRDRSPSSRETGPDCASPKKKSVPAQQREELPKVSGDPEPAAHVTDELLPTSEHMKEKKVPIEVVPDLCGMKELSDVKSLIQAWVASCAHPENEDADILAGYFTSLITFHDLEKLDCLIKYLYRQILRTKNKLWESAYQVVISQVQLIMLEAHGTKLKVKMFENS